MSSRRLRAGWFAAGILGGGLGAVAARRFVATGPPDAEGDDGDAGPPPGGPPPEAAARYRTTLQWMIGAFGAIGALLVAGLSLAGMSDLEGGDRGLAILGVGLATTGVLVVVVTTGRALAPRITSIRSVGDDPGRFRIARAVRKELDDLPDLLDGRFEDFDEFADAYLHPRRPKHDEAAKVDAKNGVTQWIAVLLARCSFRRALWWLVPGVVLVAGGVVLFALAGSDDRPSLANQPSPPGFATPVDITLTDDGRAELTRVLDETCLAEPLRGIALSGDERNGFEVVLDERPGCPPFRFTLTSTFGSAVTVGEPATP